MGWQRLSAWIEGRADSHGRAHSCCGGLPGCAGVGPAVSAGSSAGRSHGKGRGRGWHGLRSRRDKSSPAPLPGTGGVGELLSDRKSTRLNSSHLVISYAVFCLKKKK